MKSRVCQGFTQFLIKRLNSIAHKENSQNISGIIISLCLSAHCYTGDQEWRNYQFSAEVKPKLGSNHNIQFRVQGGIRSYAVGLAPNNEMVLYKNENGYRSLASSSYLWDDQQSYQLTVEAKDNHFIVSVNGDKVLEYIDNDNPYLFGKVGFSNFNGSHTHYAGVSVKGL